MDLYQVATGVLEYGNSDLTYLGWLCREDNAVWREPLVLLLDVVNGKCGQWDTCLKQRLLIGHGLNAGYLAHEEYAVRVPCERYLS